MKKVVTLLVSIIMIVSLVGCGSKATGQQEETKAKDVGTQQNEQTPGDAELLISRWAGPHADTQKDLFKDFPNGKATMDDVDYGNLKQKQVLSFQSQPGSGNYDVVWVNYIWMKEYVENGYILPLDEYIEKSGLDKNMYTDSMMKGCEFDGKVYGLPTFAQTLFLTYDSAAFEAAGQKVPETIADLIEVAKYFKETEGTGIALPAKQGGASAQVYSQIMYSTDDGYYFDEDGNLDLMSEQSIFAALAYDELCKYSIDGSLAWHHDEVSEAVRTGVAPIGITMSALANLDIDPEQSVIVDTVKYAPLPGRDGNAVANNQFWVWAVAANTQNPETAYDFVRWLTSPETEKAQTIINQQISAIKQLAADQEVISAAPFLPVASTVLENAKTDPIIKEGQTLRDAVVIGLAELASTDISARDAMEKVVESLKNVDFSDY